MCLNVSRDYCKVVRVWVFFLEEIFIFFLDLFWKTVHLKWTETPNPERTGGGGSGGGGQRADIEEVQGKKKKNEAAQQPGCPSSPTSSLRRQANKSACMKWENEEEEN